jgi:hypothetical protein
LDIYLKYNLDKFLQDKPSTFKVIGVGNFHSKLADPIGGLVTRDQLRDSLSKSSNLSDSKIGGEFPEIYLPNLILAIKMMEVMQIGHFTPVSVNEADGSLIFEEFWETSQK